MQQVAVAGASGNLGMRIVNALKQRGARPVALVREETDPRKIADLEKIGAVVKAVKFHDHASVAGAITDATCLVSAVQGFHASLVEGQTILLEAAVYAGVQRFMPSDFSADFRQIPKRQNRNFDFRKDFEEIADRADIQVTSIFNGAFAEVLSYHSPLLDLQNHQTAFWGPPDWKVDFTTMDDTAAYAAAAALDANAPRDLKIASFQANATDMAAAASSIFGSKFEVVDRGKLSDLEKTIQQMRAANPQGEAELYPRWQDLMYIHSIFSVHHERLDNNRYENLTWTPLEDFLRKLTSVSGPPQKG